MNESIRNYTTKRLPNEAIRFEKSPFYWPRLKNDNFLIQIALIFKRTPFRFH